MLHPVVLPANQPPDRFYRGGPRIATFRGETAVGNRQPEDWVGSTTTLAGEMQLGLSYLPDGTLLREAVRLDPTAWLGRAHVDRFGVDTKLLVKLLDAGQRLPVHAHPAKAFAQRHLGRAHGKAEAWFMLGPGEVYIGLERDVTANDLRELVDEQNADELLSLLHRRALLPGDTVYVPPGTLHAIGEGTFLVEVQEPEDMSILLEWRGFAIDGLAEGHLGLGFDTALGAVDTRGRSADDISGLITRAAFGDSILAPVSESYFRLGRHIVAEQTADLAPGFCIVVITAGTVTLASESGWKQELARGTTLAVPHSAGRLTASGEGEFVTLRPPVELQGDL